MFVKLSALIRHANSQLRCLFFLVLMTGMQVLAAQPYSFVRYSTAEGLPQSQVHAALSDSRGYLWLGMPGGGVSRFDGSRFENFTTKDGLPSNVIKTIFEDAQGWIWVGTSNGMAYYDGQSFHAIAFSGWEGFMVTALAQQTDSSLWVGTDRGIFQWDKSREQLLKVRLNVLLNQLYIHAFYAGQNGLWVATDRGAWRLSGDELRHFDRQSGLVGEEIRAFTRGSDGLIWMVTSDDGIHLLDETTLTVVAHRSPPAISRVTCAYTDKMGKVWLGTQDRGIFLKIPEDNRWRRLTENNGLPDNHVRTIFADQWNHIWVATSGGGIARYVEGSFVQYTRKDGLPDNRIYALAKDSQDRMWISTGSDGIMLYEERDGFRPMTLDSGLINVPVKVMLKDRQSRMWVGTDGLGLFLFDSTGLSRFSELEGLPDNWIRHLAEDSLGHIWVATRERGMARILNADNEGVIIDRIGLEEGLERQDISTLKVDPGGKVWFATLEGRIGYFENGHLRALYFRESGLPGVEIRSLTFDNRDRIWIGTAGNGIYYADLRSDNITFTLLEFPGSALVSQNVYVVVVDSDGFLWSGHEQGVDKIRLDPDGRVEDVLHLGVNEGFVGQEIFPDAVLFDQAGDIWFGTAEGLIKHHPSDRYQEATVPRIHLENILLFYQPLSDTDYARWAIPGGIREGLLLPHQQNHLGFTFKGINLSNPDQVQYRWRLLGLEAKWSPYSDNESVNYSNLPPGKYTFQVQACSGEARCSDPVEAVFRIKSPIWQLRWFQLAAVFVFLMIIWGLFRWRVHHIRLKEQAKREKLEAQHHLLRLEQKALQLQMNPHFIFNALNSIQALVSTQDFQLARREINHFAGLMRLILSNSRKASINLREEMITLEKYLRMEQFCRRTEFKFAIYPPEGIDPEEVSLPPMLLQPFVENAVIHGISSLEGGGVIAIRFSLQGEILICEISDNGIGRERAAELRKDRGTNHQSTAIHVNRERLETLLTGRQLNALEIIDLVNEEGKAAGTKVVLRIPAVLSF